MCSRLGTTCGKTQPCQLQQKFSLFGSVSFGILEQRGYPFILRFYHFVIWLYTGYLERHIRPTSTTSSTVTSTPSASGTGSLGALQTILVQVINTAVGLALQNLASTVTGLFLPVLPQVCGLGLDWWWTASLPPLSIQQN